MNSYQLKRALLYPYIRYMRHRERHQTGFIRAALELHYYRPTFYRFIAANMMNPEILHEAPIERGAVALDVGGYIGEWSARVHRKYGPHIFLFEPDPGSVQHLAERFAGHPEIRCFDYGLGDRDAELTFVRKDMGSTFHPGANDDGLGTVTARIRDVAAVLDELGLDRIDLVKINIEGGEYDLLERLIEVGRIPTIGCILIQFHEWLDGAHRRRRRIRRALKDTHSLEWDYPFVWEKWVRR